MSACGCKDDLACPHHIERLRQQLEREGGRLEAIRRLWRILSPWIYDAMDFSDDSTDALPLQVVLRIEKALRPMN